MWSTVLLQEVVSTALRTGQKVGSVSTIAGRYPRSKRIEEPLDRVIACATRENVPV